MLASRVKSNGVHADVAFLTRPLPDKLAALHDSAPGIAALWRDVIAK
ncbi:MAG: hypothetical protein AAFV36_06050 [Myxococcota bacterium]